MHITFRCPKCEQINRLFERDIGLTTDCPACDWQHLIHRGKDGSLPDDECLVCGCDDLWRQKNFPPKLGLAFVAVGAIISTIFWARMEPLWAIGVLMAFALVDFLLYRLMPDVLVCYGCHAYHRWDEIDETHPKFDLEIAERYRQEEIRLKEALQVSAKPEGS